MSRQRQDFLTWVLAAGLLVSQASGLLPPRPDIVTGALGLLGLPLIRKAQDGINRRMESDKDEAKP